MKLRRLCPPFGHYHPYVLLLALYDVIHLNCRTVPNQVLQWSLRHTVAIFLNTYGYCFECVVSFAGKQKVNLVLANVSESWLCVCLCVLVWPLLRWRHQAEGRSGLLLSVRANWSLVTSVPQLKTPVVLT